MNAPTSIAPLVALASLRAVPSSLHIDAATPGLAGVLVLFRAPGERPTPTALRTAFEDSTDRAAPVVTTDIEARAAFLASLPDTITPVAALGLAVRGARDTGAEWVHVRTVEGTSQWTYCSSTVTASSVSIHGAGTSAEACADGRLVIDAGVPTHIGDMLRAAYDAARGVVEPSRIKMLVSLYLARQGGRAITDDCYLLPETTPTTCGVLAGLVDLGGWAETIAVADPQRIARLSSPVTKSIEQQIADVVEATQAFISRAASVANGDTVTATKPDGTTETRLTRITAAQGEHARAEIAAARAAAALWRDRLSLASLDVDAQLDDLDAAATRADEAALAVMAGRKARRTPGRDAPIETVPVATEKSLLL